MTAARFSPFINWNPYVVSSKATFASRPNRKVRWLHPSDIDWRKRKIVKMSKKKKIVDLYNCVFSHLKIIFLFLYFFLKKCVFEANYLMVYWQTPNSRESTMPLYFLNVIEKNSDTSCIVRSHVTNKRSNLQWRHIFFWERKRKKCAFDEWNFSLQ